MFLRLVGGFWAPLSVALIVSVVVAQNVLAAPADAIARPDEGLSPEKRLLLDECLEKLDELRDFHRNVTMEVVKEIVFDRYELDGSVSTIRVVTNYVYLANDDLGRLDITPIVDERRPELDPPKSVLVQHDQYIVGGPLEIGGEPIVLNWEQEAVEGWGGIQGTDIPNLAYAVLGMEIKAILFLMPMYSANAHIRDITVEQDEQTGEDLVILSVETSTDVEGREGGKMDLSGRFVFYRDRSWVLKEYEWGTPEVRLEGDARYTVQCFYEGEKDGVPLVKKVTQERLGRNPGTTGLRTETTLYEVIRFDPNPAPKSEFTPEAIGVSLGGRTNPWWTRLLILLSGVALLLVYRYLRKREKKAA